MSGAKAAFAPLPTRAIGDKRLSGIHFRVLAAVAMHDRMSGSRGKGQGCWAGNKTLAVECGCDYSRLSATITDLGRWGYVEREQHPLNKRLRVYRITYTDADIAFTKTSNSLPVGKQSPDDAGQIVCEPAKSDAETVCRDFQESEQNQLDAEVNIFRETGKILGETSVRDSAEAAPLGSGATTMLSIGAQLARFERELKGGARADVGAMKRWHDWLEELHYSLDINDPNYGRVYRLLEEVDWPEEVCAESRDEALDPTVTASGTAHGAMRNGANGKATASPPTPRQDDGSSLAEMFPKLYDAFAPCEAPWEPTPGQPDVLGRLIHASRDERAQASVVLKRKGPDAAAAWVKANLAAPL